ncbi:pentapeptide repeat-containing protein [Streptomyces sp. NBC_00273]|uniref:pentapeptide repeat-containing protein n=1 Tax=Streptomyces sp. NBC_00273 TaxID=2903644 RepID=UPI002E2DF01D|nr:pentapeptide repeat-containing protein [Streptomyces sp. NBC_00273]
MSAIAVVGFTWKSITQVNNEQALTREGQITDRYTDAVEDLGNKGSEDMRLGGVYALQRLMQDSPRDQATVIDVLSSFIRAHSKKPKSGDRETSLKTILTSDVTAAAAVLASRDSRNDGTTRVNLFEADLHRVNLTGGDLSNANLNLTDLRKANLREAILYDATLGDANLSGASLSRADLRGVILARADLRQATLGGADLRDAYLGYADLRDADLYDADLRDANLYGANLNGANLDGANLDCASFSETDLKGALNIPEKTAPEECDTERWLHPDTRPKHHRR